MSNQNLFKKTFFVYKSSYISLFSKTFLIWSVCIYVYIKYFYMHAYIYFYIHAYTYTYIYQIYIYINTSNNVKESYLLYVRFTYSAGTFKGYPVLLKSKNSLIVSIPLVLNPIYLGLKTITIQYGFYEDCTTLF